MFLKKNNKGQGALEYLLIIGSALVIAIVVIMLVLSTGESQRNVVVSQSDTFTKFFDDTIIPPIVIKTECTEHYFKFEIRSAYSSFYYLNNNYELATLEDPDPNNIYSIPHNNLPQEKGHSYLQIAAITGDKYSRFSSPAILCNLD